MEMSRIVRVFVVKVNAILLVKVHTHFIIAHAHLYVEIHTLYVILNVHAYFVCKK